TMIAFAWGYPTDPLWAIAAKRVFLLLPVGAIIAGLWASILCVLSVVVRQKRTEFFKAFLVTWWDLGKSIFAFWGGFFRFLFVLVNSLFALVRVLVVGVWLFIQDILLVPFRVIKTVALNISAPGLPWIAVTLTVIWCLVEAVIFTYVMTPLVLDTLSNMTGGALTETIIRIPLFLFLLFLVLGSYAVLSNFVDAVKSKQWGTIVKIAAVEAVAIMVEVMFLYRELVDSLVPWFAQHASKDFDLGIGGTLAIAVLAWMGVRGMTWFLFAAHGVPVITAIIQGRGLKPTEAGERAQMKDTFAYTVGFYYHIKTDLNFIQEKGDDLLGAFILPPLQVVSAVVNFFTLLVAGHHLFLIPFKSIRDVMHSKDILADSGGKKAKKEGKRAKPAAAAEEVRS
ncbi:MAG TPA: hypothetical protein VJ873_11665, partial [bacterium]|nr:hypothetical protein [bacterium]